jgi:hypothetical protein
MYEGLYAKVNAFALGEDGYLRVESNYFLMLGREGKKGHTGGFPPVCPARRRTADRRRFLAGPED